MFGIFEINRKPKKSYLNSIISSLDNKVTGTLDLTNLGHKPNEYSNDKVWLKCVALKKDKDRDIFKKEIDRLKMCQGEHVVMAITTGILIKQDIGYMVLEHAWGAVSDLIALRRVPTYQHAQNFMKQLYSAINAIHQKGLIHRDINPRNILLFFKDRLIFKISDLSTSISKKDCKLQKTNKITGKCAYMSPEIAIDNLKCRKNKYQDTDDIWACGIASLEVLSGMYWVNESTDLLVRNNNRLAILGAIASNLFNQQLISIKNYINKVYPEGTFTMIFNSCMSNNRGCRRLPDIDNINTLFAAKSLAKNDIQYWNINEAGQRNRL